MAEWERQERHQRILTGPPVVDAVELIAELNEALSDYWLIAAEPPHSYVPPGAVTVSAAGGVIAVRIEHIEASKETEPAGDQPVEAPDAEEGEGRA